MKRYVIIASIVVSIVILPLIVFAGSQKVSGVTAQTVINNARVILRETTADWWADSDLLQYLNDGHRDIALLTHCIQGTEAVTLVSGVTEYTISTSYTKIHGAIYNNASGVTNKSLIYASMFDSRLGMGGESVGQRVSEPVYWDEDGGIFYIWPEPMTSIDGDNITVYLSELPSDRTLTGGTSNILTPQIYDRALTFYIVAEAYYQIDKVWKAQVYEGRYIQELGIKKQDLIQKPAETPK